MSESDINTGDISGIVHRGRPFLKMHGLRNDFVIVDARKTPYRPAVTEIFKICDRHEGIGGDDLLVMSYEKFIAKSRR